MAQQQTANSQYVDDKLNIIEELIDSGDIMQANQLLVAVERQSHTKVQAALLSFLQGL